jgi:hypothetical protein
VQLDRLQLLVRRCDWTRAEAMAREIIRQCEAASAGQPDDAVLRRDVAVGNNMLAVALNGLKRYGEAMAAMEISYQKRLGLNQAELIEVCWLGVDTCGRAGQFLRAADWCDRGAEAVKALMDQKQANLYQISERQRFLSYGLAYRALPKTLETPSHLDSLPPAVALRARGIRGIFAARTGVRDLAKADEHILRESKDIEARQFHAVICILLSELTQDSNEKAEFGKRGMEQLSSVLRQYPSVIQLLYLYPELDTVRQSSEFTALRQELVK